MELTAERVESIVAMTREGRWPDRAAGELGISKETFDGWVDAGAKAVLADEASLERDLVERIYVADCQAEGEWFRGLHNRSETGRYINDFLAFMARRWPERWVERKPEPERDVRFEDEVRLLFAGADAARKADSAKQ